MFPNKVYVTFVYILIKLVTIEKKLFTNYATVVWRSKNDWRSKHLLLRSHFLGIWLFIWITVLGSQVSPIIRVPRPPLLVSCIIRVLGRRSRVPPLRFQVSGPGSHPWVGSQVPGLGSHPQRSQSQPWGGSQILDFWPTKIPGPWVPLFRYIINMTLWRKRNIIKRTYFTISKSRYLCLFKRKILNFTQIREVQMFYIFFMLFFIYMLFSFIYKYYGIFLFVNITIFLVG